MALARDAGGEHRASSGLVLGEIPNAAADREIEALGKLAAPLHVVDRGVGRRNDFAELMPAMVFLLLLAPG